MTETNWDEKIEYLRESRQGMWNMDYLEFLVQKVWKIDRPVRIVDFGCGMGYMGSVLLPLLPPGSTYTGLDSSPKLLEQAREAFAHAPWETRFEERDLTRYAPEARYDLAICQGVLIHIPEPFKVLEKMAQSVVPGGRVICCEPFWPFTHFGTYRHGMEVYSHDDWGIAQKLFDAQIEDGLRDPYIGIKIPVMMRDLGLQNVDARLNERVNISLYDPDPSVVARDREERRADRKEKRGAGLVSLEPAEVDRYVEATLRTEDFENDRDTPLPTVATEAWFISYGEK